MIKNTNLIKTNLQICSRCIYNERVSAITFDNEGVCSYCKQLDALVKEYGTGSQKGKEKFYQIIEDIKRDGKNKKYDCIIRVSGGTDSSYMLYLAKKYVEVKTSCSLL